MATAPVASLALHFPSFSWTRQGGTAMAIAVFVFMLIVLQLITGQGISYFDVSTVSASATTLALAAVGETIVILAGGLDLSAGAVVSLVNVVLVTQLAEWELGTVTFTIVERCWPLAWAASSAPSTAF